MRRPWDPMCKERAMPYVNICAVQEVELFQDIDVCIQCEVCGEALPTDLYSNTGTEMVFRVGCCEKCYLTREEHQKLLDEERYGKPD